MRVSKKIMEQALKRKAARKVERENKIGAMLSNEISGNKDTSLKRLLERSDTDEDSSVGDAS